MSGYSSCELNSLAFLSFDFLELLSFVLIRTWKLVPSKRRSLSLFCNPNLHSFGFPLQSVAASCVWLAAKLEESPKEISAVLQVLWRMERRRNNLPIEVLDLHSPVCSITQIAPLSFSSDVYYSAFTSLGTKFEPQYALQKYLEMKTALIRTERHLLKEMGFICHVEHPHKFIMSYLKALEAPVELMQEAWNLANDR